ncbi:hypothetical protein EMIHUDRAFT_438485 [Emiliania huxleyi CCMP1516]|uniref:Uncharacterized protein n=2 Tax=Emiliania huxleyi TaxID=2903 RepID=A0A0D3I8T9_EMIH1|nr:hypothetical protein EMIHUDRAFT_438485 [Emiliania huxleyi CCMP1516]EOD07674.1 hypothetical protein EMIHUDRAFT_438485 [Emiliania huxleyi CCMP1516]|eukprot:XP_005760103.1 hypothetical protein EMIHUDRAFT_438485 [Emiliania huxleyi CCMP1516]
MLPSKPHMRRTCSSLTCSWFRALQPSRKQHQGHGRGALGGPQEQLVYQDARSVPLQSRARGRDGPGWRHCRQRLPDGGLHLRQQHQERWGRSNC